MGGQKGTSANRDRLKELSDMIRICTSQIRRCLHVQENHKTIIDTYRDEQGAIECKILEVTDELQDAPAELLSLRRQLDKFRTEQDKITGHVTGRTKLVEKYKNTKAKLEKLEAELSDSGFNVGDILSPDEELETRNSKLKPKLKLKLKPKPKLNHKQNHKLNHKRKHSSTSLGGLTPCWPARHYLADGGVCETLN